MKRMGAIIVFAFVGAIVGYFRSFSLMKWIHGYDHGGDLERTMIVSVPLGGFAGVMVALFIGRDTTSDDGPFK